MNRFFIPPEQIRGDVVTLPPDVGRQIQQVLRLNILTDEICVLDGSGTEYLVRLDGLREGRLTGQVLQQQDGSREPSCSLQLFFSLTRREKVEWILQKGTEIGVSAFQPLVCERSLSRESAIDPARRQRWEAIIREAAEQSGRSRLPDLRQVLAFQQLTMPASPAGCVGLIAWEGAPVQLRMTKTLLASQGGRKPDLILVVVGPEGGFSEAEASLAQRRGFRLVSLGSSILRMETACLVAPALARHIVETWDGF